MEARFGRDFSGVRVHTDSRAAHSAASVNALAYTLGQNVVFGAGQYAPRSAYGRQLLAHELAHVVQQAGPTMPTDTLEIDRHDSPFEQEADRASEGISAGTPANVPPARSAGVVQLQRVGFGDVRIAEARESLREKIKVDYKKAERANKRYAKNGPAWEGKLATVAVGKYSEWSRLWRAGKYDAFANEVASYQLDLGMPEEQVDGVLGSGTWARLAGLGEAMAGIEKVTWPESEYVCTTASVERIKRGVKLATGKAFELPEDTSASEFKIIAQTITSRMLDVDRRYRGAGPAGALVYAGLGTFISEADIWAGRLEPGAVLQVWGHRKDFDLLRDGEIGKDTKRRRIRDSDGTNGSFYGSSFVFVRYDTETNTRMLVRHYGQTEWKRRSSYDVWVAANPLTP